MENSYSRLQRVLSDRQVVTIATTLQVHELDTYF